MPQSSNDIRVVWKVNELFFAICSKGIYPDIAEAKHEYWSSFAPLPLEIVMAAGQKAKDDKLSGISMFVCHLPNRSFFKLAPRSPSSSFLGE